MGKETFVCHNIKAVMCYLKLNVGKQTGTSFPSYIYYIRCVHIAKQKIAYGTQPLHIVETKEKV